MDGRSSAIAIVTEPQFMSFIKLNNAGMHVPMPSPVSDESTSNSGTPQKNDCQTPRARSRRKAPKVRSGCVTCKKRRVKCDERKPGCYRCEKFGAQCDGYATNKQKPWTIFQGHLPGDARQSESRALLEIKSPSITALQPRRTAFSSQQEYSYFQVFSQRTASSIAGYFTGTLWNRLILQACEHHPSVRHAIIAIGALDRTLDGAPSIRSLTDVKDGLEPPTMHHAFALQQYGKAVKLMRDALTDSQPDMRITLITCLLAFCFETFHGNRQSALTHAQSGIKMLNSWLPTLRRNGNYSVGSPAPEVIEDELVQAFATLDCDTISFHAEVPPIPEVIAVDARRTMDAMPIVFEDLGSARVFLDFTRRMAIHFLASSYAWDFASSGDGVTHQLPTIRPWQHHPESIAQWNRHCEALLRWNSAFQPLLSKARHDKGADLVNAIGIELRFRATYASFASTLVPEAHFEIASADFNVVLNIAEELSRAYSTYDIRERPSYMFDGSYVGSLLVFITHCRDPVLRRRGIRLLEEVPRREGIWDSMVGAKLCRTIIEIEEEGWNGVGEIPWNNRVRFMRPTFDMHERKGRLSYKTEVQLGSDGPMSIKDFHW